jgi:hypothetical protein
METMARESWTDERLDDLSNRVDGGFRDTHAEFALVRSEMRSEFAAVRSEMRSEFAAVRSEMRTEIGSLRSEMHEGFAAIRGELAALNRMLTIALFGLVSTVLGAIVAAVAIHLF